MHERRQLFMCRARFGNERFCFCVNVFAALCMAVGDADQATTKPPQQLAAIRRAALERIHALIEPAQHYLLCRAGVSDGMNADVVLLANAIEAADALFKQVRIERQVPHHDAMGELEVATFRADFRTEQQACAVRVGEIRRIAITLEQGHALVEARNQNTAAGAQGFFQRDHFGRTATDQQ